MVRQHLGGKRALEKDGIAPMTRHDAVCSDRSQISAASGPKTRRAESRRGRHYLPPVDFTGVEACSIRSTPAWSATARASAKLIPSRGCSGERRHRLAGASTQNV